MTIIEEQVMRIKRRMLARSRRPAMPRITARFWTWHHGSGAAEGGWVKLSLKEEGDKLETSSHCKHEEGWSVEGMSWEHIGDGVQLDYWHDGRDCDGFSGGSGTSVCRLQDLAKIERHEDCFDDDSPIVMVPDWSDAKESVYDRTAEAAGY